ALDLVRTLGLHAPERVAAAAKAIRTVGALDEAGQDADLVVESVVEDLAAKGDVLGQAAARFPSATLASNTSSISLTRIGEAASAADRTLGTHYWNPPLLMPLVEVISGEETAPGRLAAVAETLRSLGKRPVRVMRDVPGFVWNRLQLALLREAAWIVESGVATPETVDEIVRDGLARRWRLTGPFQTAALGGPDTFTRVAANLFPVLSTATELRDLDRWLPFDKAELDAFRTRRDDELLAELRRDRAADQAPPLPGAERGA
ncbi:MAG: 3-hydroxyacyl-CoA dehydrogenase family protein, partial [Thermomicrobiales bacterium]